MRKVILIISLFALIVPCYSEWELTGQFEDEDGPKIVDIWDIECYDENNIFVVGNNPIYQYLKYSTDKGQSWKRVTIDSLKKKTGFINPVSEIEVLTPDKAIVTAREKYYWISDEGFNKWELFEVPDTNFRMYDINMYDDKFGIIWSKNLFYITYDGGYTWEKGEFKGLEKYPHYCENFFFLDKTKIFSICYDSTQSTNKKRYLIKSIDGGKTWKHLSYMNNKVFEFFWVNEDIGFFAGGNIYNTLYKYNNTILKTTDGGYTWEVQVDTLIDETAIYLTDIKFLDENRGFAAGRREYWATTNGGETWILDTAKLNNPYLGRFYSYDMTPSGSVFGTAYVMNIYKKDYYFTDIEQEHETTNNILLYPNPCPVSGELNCSIPFTSGNLSIKIYDLSGSVVDSQSLNTHRMTPSHPMSDAINLRYKPDEALSPGVYIIEFSDGNRTWREKVVFE